MASLEIHAGGKRLVYDILEPELTIGRAASSTLRLQAEGVADVHLRLTQAGATYRVEDLGDDLHVNGERKAVIDLAHGDQLDFGGVQVLFLLDAESRPLAPIEYDLGRSGERSDTPARRPGIQIKPIKGVSAPGPAPRSVPTPRGPTAGKPGSAGVSVARSRRADVEPDDGSRRARSRRQRGMPRWLVFWNVVLVTIVVGVLLYGALTSDADEPRTGDLLALARSQLHNGDVQGALETLDVAVQRDTDAKNKKAIRAMRERVQAQITRDADRGALSAANARYNALDRFVKRYLAGAAPEQPALREFARLADAWQASYEAICRKYEEERGLAEQVSAWSARFRDRAAMNEPDRAEDALFRANRRSRFRRPYYREAIAILEEWLGANPNADAPELKERLLELRRDGEKWVQKRLGEIDRMLGQGHDDRAIGALEHLVEHGGLDEWLGDARQKLAELRGR